MFVRQGVVRRQSIAVESTLTVTLNFDADFLPWVADRI